MAGGNLAGSSTPSVFLYSPEGQCNYPLAPIPLATHSSAIAVLNGVITLWLKEETPDHDSPGVL